MLVCLIVLIGVIYLMFVYCFQGMNEVAHGREVKRVFAENDGQDDFDLKLDAEEVDPKFRYCTEFVVELVQLFSLVGLFSTPKVKKYTLSVFVVDFQTNPAMLPADLKATFKDLGESIVPLVASKWGKIHIHTNEPGAVFKRAATLGLLKKRKVEDMRSQVNISFFHLQDNPNISLNIFPIVFVSFQAGSVGSDGWRNPKLRILVDSTTDMPPEYIARSGLIVCPCRVFVPGATEDGYRDYSGKYALLW